MYFNSIPYIYKIFKPSFFHTLLAPAPPTLPIFSLCTQSLVAKDAPFLHRKVLKSYFHCKETTQLKMCLEQHMLYNWFVPFLFACNEARFLRT